jgi:hypothetical protein
MADKSTVDEIAPQIVDYDEDEDNLDEIEKVILQCVRAPWHMVVSCVCRTRELTFPSAAPLHF